MTAVDEPSRDNDATENSQNRKRHKSPALSRRRYLSDPISEHRDWHETETRIAIASHPLHAMLVAFPITLAMATLAADALFWWTGDHFWPRAALWASGVGFVMGLLAGIAGTVELLIVPGIRIRAAAWTHFVLAVMLLSLLGINWWIRIDDPVVAVLPWGASLSLLAVCMTGVTGWHGGKLVFDFRIGTQSEPHGEGSSGAQAVEADEKQERGHHHGSRSGSA